MPASFQCGTKTSTKEEARELNVQERGRALLSVMAERVTGFEKRATEETLAVEEPLEIRLGYEADQGRAVKSISVTMRTPGNDFELAVGFLMTEGVIRDVNEY
jgi:FdhD protein